MHIPWKSALWMHMQQAFLVAWPQLLVLTAMHPMIQWLDQISCRIWVLALTSSFPWASGMLLDVVLWSETGSWVGYSLLGVVARAQSLMTSLGGICKYTSPCPGVSAPVWCFLVQASRRRPELCHERFGRPGQWVYVQCTELSWCTVEFSADSVSDFSPGKWSILTWVVYCALRVWLREWEYHPWRSRRHLCAQTCRSSPIGTFLGLTRYPSVIACIDTFRKACWTSWGMSSRHQVLSDSSPCMHLTQWRILSHQSL